MKVWLTRDIAGSGMYAIFTGPQPLFKDGDWQTSTAGGSAFLKAMCCRAFHRFCKIRLRKGQCVSIKLTHLKNGFKFEVKTKK